MKQLQLLENQLVLAINHTKTEQLDLFVSIIMSQYSALAVFALVSLFVMRAFGLRKYMLFCGLLVVGVVGGELINIIFAKPLVGRLRPTHNPDLESSLLLLDDFRGGLYSFYSSLAAILANLAMLVFLSMRVSFPLVLIILYMLLLAFASVYTGLYYLGDILAGWLVGGVMAYVIYTVYSKIKESGY